MDNTAELQQLLNASVAHVREQGRPSFHRDEDGDIACLYRSSDGLSCAAGIFIENYDEGMEGISFHVVALRFPALLAPLAAVHSYFVSDVLQLAHDTSAEENVDVFRARYEESICRLVERWNKDYGTKLVVPEAA